MPTGRKAKRQTTKRANKPLIANKKFAAVLGKIKGERPNLRLDNTSAAKLVKLCDKARDTGDIVTCEHIIKLLHSAPRPEAMGSSSRTATGLADELESIISESTDAVQPVQHVREADDDTLVGTRSKEYAAATLPDPVMLGQHRNVSPKSIKPGSPFAELLPISPDVLKAVTENITSYGFDPGQPLTVWLEHDVLLDGHTRLRAAIKAGIDSIPAVYVSFRSEDAALDYAISRQRDRRQLTDDVLLHLVQQLDKRNTRGGDTRSTQAKSKAQDCATGKTSEKTARLLGISPRKVEQIRTIQDHSNKEIMDRVLAGDWSVNKACGEIKKRKTEKSATPVKPSAEAPIGPDFAGILMALENVTRNLLGDSTELKELLRGVLQQVRTMRDTVARREA